MLHRRRIVRLWQLLAFAVLCCAEELAAGHSGDAESTCAARTTGYITHILPQQCPATPRPKPAITSTSLSVTITGVPAVVESEVQSITTEAATTISQLANVTVSGTEVSSLTSTLERLSTTTAHIPSETQPSSVATATSDTTRSNTPQASATPVDDDGDALFGDTNFLSFEEWKKQNLARSGQSAETLGQGRTGPGSDRSRPGSDNSLESLGEDSEIVLDFTGFGGPANVPVRDIPSGDGRSYSAGGTAKVASPSGMPRSRDAGKTCKQRFNYASFDCAANVLKTNPQCTHSSAILVENKDSYMLNKCAADNKFIIVELCDDILIDTIVLANFEFFSSMFRTFKVSVSDKYPVKADRWKELGTFEARNSRDIQAFLIENPLIWARYLRIEFITQYGSEYYCPVSLLRVHGTTMMAEFRHQEELARGEVDNDDEEEAVSMEVMSTPVTQATVDTVSLDPKVTPSAPAKVYEPIFEQPINETTTSVQVSSVQATTHAGVAVIHSSVVSGSTNPSAVPSVISNSASQTVSSSGKLAEPLLSSKTAGQAISDTTPAPASLSTETDTPNYVDQPSKEVASNSMSTQGKSGALSTAQPTMGTLNSSSVFSNSTSGVSSALSSPASPPASSPPASSPPSASTASSIPPASAASSSSTRSSSASLVSASHTPSNQPPATQESFFKSIHKRLQFLETNATLSLQYIESQSQSFREAFSRVEKRNLARTSTFLDALNATVSAELAHFKAEYEQLWQSTILELVGQREENRREAALMADQVRMLAEELVGQKRLIAVQATLLLLCLGLVVFSKFVGGAPGVDAGVAQLMQELVPRARRGAAKDDGVKGSPRWEGVWTPTSPGGGEMSSPRDAGTEDEGSGKDAMGTILDEEDDEDGRLGGFDAAARLTKSAPTTPRVESTVELGLGDASNVSASNEVGDGG